MSAFYVFAGGRCPRLAFISAISALSSSFPVVVANVHSCCVNGMTEKAVEHFLRKTSHQIVSNCADVAEN
jgi:ABC-type lipoprotein release transport system permease subunit